MLCQRKQVQHEICSRMEVRNVQLWPDDIMGASNIDQATELPRSSWQLQLQVQMSGCPPGTRPWHHFPRLRDSQCGKSPIRGQSIHRPNRIASPSCQYITECSIVARENPASQKQCVLKLCWKLEESRMPRAEKRDVVLCSLCMFSNKVSKQVKQ